ncbi:UNVERIFIED_CONTAM: hypothetical protein K2H54_047458 [Gekko kuhli]
MGAGTRERTHGDTGDLPRQTLDYEKESRENKEFLEEFFAKLGDAKEHDPRQRYVVWFRYKGLDIEKLTEDYMVGKLMLGQLGLPKRDRLAIIMLPGLQETDVCLVGESQVLTVSFQTINVPEEDVEMWLQRHCNILMPIRKHLNQWGSAFEDSKHLRKKQWFLQNKLIVLHCERDKKEELRQALEEMEIKTDRTAEGKRE